MKNLSLYLLVIIIAICFYGCGNTEDTHTQKKETKNTNKTPDSYTCPESDISVEGSANSFDNKRGEFSAILTGKVKCKEAPLPNARLKVEFPERSTNFNISSDADGNYKTQVSRLTELPTNKMFKVTLLTPKDTLTTKVFEFKVSAPAQ